MARHTVPAELETDVRVYRDCQINDDDREHVVWNPGQSYSISEWSDRKGAECPLGEVAPVRVDESQTRHYPWHAYGSGVHIASIRVEPVRGCLCGRVEHLQGAVYGYYEDGVVWRHVRLSHCRCVVILITCFRPILYEKPARPAERRGRADCTTSHH
jgi:hypothetical protein